MVPPDIERPLPGLFNSGAQPEPGKFPDDVGKSQVFPDILESGAGKNSAKYPLSLDLIPAMGNFPDLIFCQVIVPQEIWPGLILLHTAIVLNWRRLKCARLGG